MRSVAKEILRHQDYLRFGKYYLPLGKNSQSTLITSPTTTCLNPLFQRVSSCSRVVSQEANPFIVTELFLQKSSWMTASNHVKTKISPQVVLNFMAMSKRSKYFFKLIKIAANVLGPVTSFQSSESQVLYSFFGILGPNRIQDRDFPWSPWYSKVLDHNFFVRLYSTNAGQL